jgi:adenosine deaminase
MLTREFVRALPKAELHLHLEGAVPWTLVRAQLGDLPPRPAWWAENFRFDDFTQFRGVMQTCMSSLLDLRGYGAAAGAIFRDLAAQNVRYVEISFDIVRALDRGLQIADVARVVKGATPPGLVTRVFAAFSQHKPDRTPPEITRAVLRAPDLDGISLHGDETVQSTDQFVAAFAGARERGLLTKAHAGELMGPASVVAVLDRLGVRRIEHGVRAVEDPAVVDRLVHPLAHLHTRGVRVTINTDDPTAFGRTLTEELVSVIDDLGIAPAEVARMQANAFAVAAMPADAREAALAEIVALAREIETGKA